MERKKKKKQRKISTSLRLHKMEFRLHFDEIEKIASSHENLSKTATVTLHGNTVDP